MMHLLRSKCFIFDVLEGKELTTVFVLRPRRTENCEQVQTNVKNVISCELHFVSEVEALHDREQHKGPAFHIFRVAGAPTLGQI